MPLLVAYWTVNPGLFLDSPTPDPMNHAPAFPACEYLCIAVFEKHECNMQIRKGWCKNLTGKVSPCAWTVWFSSARDQHWQHPGTRAEDQGRVPAVWVSVLKVSDAFETLFETPHYSTRTDSSQCPISWVFQHNMVVINLWTNHYNYWLWYDWKSHLLLLYFQVRMGYTQCFSDYTNDQYAPAPQNYWELHILVFKKKKSSCTPESLNCAVHWAFA